MFTEHRNARLHLLNDVYEPEQLKGMIACMDVFVGTRMHSNIFAIGAGIPTAAIAYQQKTSGIMEELGFADLVIDIGDITEDKLVALYRRLCDRQAAIRDHLQSVIPQVRRSARAAAEICLSVAPPR